MAEKHYAWATLYNGGETEEARDGRNLVINRNMVEAGSVVSKKSLGVSDDEWNHLVASGSIRPYPLPELVEGESPAEAIMRQITKGGEVPMDTLLSLALAHPPAINPPAEEQLSLPEGA